MFHWAGVPGKTHAGETMSLGWSENTLGPPQRSDQKSEHLCIEEEDGWMVLLNCSLGVTVGGPVKEWRTVQDISRLLPTETGLAPATTDSACTENGQMGEHNHVGKKLGKIQTIRHNLFDQAKPKPFCSTV